MENAFYEKYRNLVWKYVNRFCASTPVLRLNAVIEIDDLFQECMLHLYETYKRSGMSMDDFKFHTLDFKNCMCAMVQRSLPLSVPARTTDFTKLCNLQPECSSIDSTTRVLKNRQDEEDIHFLIDMDRCMDGLSPLETDVMRWILDGREYRVRGAIEKKHGVTRKKFWYTYNKLIERVKKNMRGAWPNV